MKGNKHTPQDKVVESAPVDDGTITINFGDTWKKTVAFVKKHHLVLLILIPLFISIFLRVGPAYLPEAENLAMGNVDQTIKDFLRQTVAAQYPQLPDDKKQQLVDERFFDIKKQGTFTVNGQILVIEDLVKQATAELKNSFQDDTGQTYLIAIDPYYYSRQARNYVEHGFEDDVEIDGLYYPQLTAGGYPTEQRNGNTKKITSFHTFFQVVVYKIINIFGDASVMKASFYVPVIISVLAIFPAFFIARRIAGNFAGFFASLLIAMHPSFLIRTMAGFSDTDGYNVTLPLFIMWFFLEALEAKDIKKAVLFSGLAALVTGIFSFTWGGWWFIFDFVLLVFLVFLGHELVKIGIDKYKQKERDVKKDLQALKPALICLFVFLICSGIFISLVRNPSSFASALSEPFKFLSIKDVGTAKIWPNVLTTVAELNEVSLSGVVHEISLKQPLLFFFALLGLILMFLKIKILEKKELQQLSVALIVYILLMLFALTKSSFIVFAILASIPLAYFLLVDKNISKRAFFIVASSTYYLFLMKGIKFFDGKLILLVTALIIPLAVGILYTLFSREEVDVQSLFLIALWFFATIFASTKGIRFLLLLVPAFALAVGIGVAKITSLFSRYASSLFEINRKYLFSLFAILSLLLLLTPTVAVHAQAQSQFPSMNDQWWNALSKIDQEASEDAIITSWWDFGHWFKFIARRAVTFDGGSQDSPPAHWVGKTLLTANEKEAVGILRMLDCGLSLGHDTLYEHTNDDLQTIKMLNDMFVLNREGAKAYLREKNVPEVISDSILKYTHCDPPEAYFITSQDMVNKAGVWAHFGSWDFTKAKIVNIVNNNDKKESISKVESLGVDSAQAASLYDEVRSLGINKDANTWIASWPNYYTGSSACQLAEDKVICSNGILLDTSTETVEIHIQEGVINPKVYSTVNAKGDFALLENKNPSGNNPNQISASLIPNENGGYLGVLHHEALAGSMFNRLFYFKGKGLDCFNLFEYQKTVTADDVYIWKVDWSCGKE